MPPTPTLRASSKLKQQSTDTIMLTANANCTGLFYIVAYVSAGGTGNVGEITSITSTGGRITGWSKVPHSGFGSAFPTASNGFDPAPTGPRAGWMFNLQGSVLSGDVITLVCATSLIEWAVFLIDEVGGAGICHVCPTTSLANATALHLNHQRRLHANNGIRGLVYDGGGAINEGITADSEGTTLDSWVFNPGVASGNLLYRNGDFTGDVIDWSWATVLSNQAILWEVMDPASPNPSDVDFELLEVRNDTSGSFSSSTFTPQAGDVIVMAIVGEKNPPIDPDSVVDTAGSPNTYTLVTDGTTTATLDTSDGSHRAWVYCHRYLSSPGALHISFTHPSLVGSVIWILRLKGCPGSTDTDWVGKVVKQVAASATALSGLNLGTIGTASGVLAFAVADNATQDWDFEDGFVPLSPGNQLGLGFETESMIGVWLGSDNDATPGFTVSGAARNLGGIAIEVKGTPIPPPATDFIGRSTNIDLGGKVTVRSGRG